MFYVFKSIFLVKSITNSAIILCMHCDRGLERREAQPGENNALNAMWDFSVLVLRKKVVELWKEIKQVQSIRLVIAAYVNS